MRYHIGVVSCPAADPTGIQNFCCLDVCRQNFFSPLMQLFKNGLTPIHDVHIITSLQFIIRLDPAVPNHSNKICVIVVLSGFSLQVRKDKKGDSSKKKKKKKRAVWSFDPFSTKSFSNEHHEFLLALVYLFQVVYELCELDVSVVRHEKRLSGFAEELYELTVVAWADVRQPRVRRVDIGPDRGIQ